MKLRFDRDETKQEFLKKAREALDGDTASRGAIIRFATDNGYSTPSFIFSNKQRLVSRGKYSLCAETIDNVVPLVRGDSESFIPSVDPAYVPFGFFDWLKTILQSRTFYPIYITGFSGNGKTCMVEQACAHAGRELIRINITRETDEFDLIGSYDLIDGNTIRREGPALIAMRRGAVLLMDETDYGSERLLCLQPILEGKPYYDKKTGEIVHPAPGFTVIATANTKGKGSDDGRYMGANILNDAFLERFAITVEQNYPPPAIETKILKKAFARYGIDPDDVPLFIDNLIKWVGIIRTTFDEGAIEEVISTRRLTHIAHAYSIFKNAELALDMTLNRFETATKSSFVELFTKLSPTPYAVKNEPTPENAPDDWIEI